MLDITAAPSSSGAQPPGESVHKTAAAARRLKSRYGFEARFQIYGIVALSLAVLALVSLLWTVFFNAAGAVRSVYLKLPVKLEQQAIDPKGTGDPDVIRKGQFSLLVKRSLRAAFPTVKGRSERRALYELVSDGAALKMRETVKSDPSLVGKTQQFSLLASDDVALWIKGYVDTLKKISVTGRATPTGTTGDIKIIAESNSFQSVLTTVKEALLEAARVRRRQAAAQQRGVRVTRSRLATITTEADREKLQQQLAGFEQRVKLLITRAEALEARANASGGAESLQADLSSFFVRINGGVVKASRVSADTIEGHVLLPISSTETAQAGKWELLTVSRPEESRRIKDEQVIWLNKLEREGRIETSINWDFLTSSNSREAELAGVWGAAVGSFWTMVVTFLLAFPIGVMAAIYLEEFAPKNMITNFIEVNINNLAAVPSIVFGLLGLAVFIGFFGVPRSTALAGGIVLALMTLPTIIIASRAAVKAVPPSIREAALGVGASKVQTVSHHVLPLAMPGILTGSILGMAQALGETAPLLMIGMFAFIREVPAGVMEPATALPVQVYQWSDFPERMFEMKTAAAIVVLLLFLVIMNLMAIVLRKRFERRW
jgi:phosphate transport system permease protein